jgi:hypothetical protein
MRLDTSRPAHRSEHLQVPPDLPHSIHLPLILLLPVLRLLRQLLLLPRPPTPHLARVPLSPATMPRTTRRGSSINQLRFSRAINGKKQKLTQSVLKFNQVNRSRLPLMSTWFGLPPLAGSGHPAERRTLSGVNYPRVVRHGLDMSQRKVSPERRSTIPFHVSHVSMGCQPCNTDHLQLYRVLIVCTLTLLTFTLRGF